MILFVYKDQGRTGGRGRGGSAIHSGASFSGSGKLVIVSGSQLAPHNLAAINVLVENRGTLAPGGTGIGRTDVLDFVQSATGTLPINLNGASLGNFDRLLVNGGAQLAGTLELTLGGGYTPMIGDTFIVLSATGGRTGTFNPLAQPAGMPARSLRSEESMP